MIERGRTQPDWRGSRAEQRDDEGEADEMPAGAVSCEVANRPQGIGLIGTVGAHHRDHLPFR